MAKINNNSNFDVLLNADDWHKSCVHDECTLHQLSPYIGKLKSTIASELISNFSKPGDLVVDAFSGSGTVPLEAILLGRNVFAADISSYSYVLTHGKLSAPLCLDNAIDEAKKMLRYSRMRNKVDLRTIPKWIRNFFHPDTLREVIAFADTCIKHENYFLFACLLGILHHQRPGFLSFPSSHLVPYLRDKSFPKNKFPEMYEYRELESRIFSKIKRAYKRFNGIDMRNRYQFQKGSIDTIKFPNKFDCLITSPPYMNTLDYVRDNRLRMWFTNREFKDSFDDYSLNNKNSFIKSIQCLAVNTNKKLSNGGHAILVVGSKSKKNKGRNHPSEVVRDLFEKYAEDLSLIATLDDDIPDVRRSRRECRDIKKEEILIYKKSL